MLVNREEGIKLTYNSEELYNEIVKAYIDESDEYKSNLAEHLSEKNWREYAVIAHAIKSNSKQIGANELFEEALSMELAAKASDEATILAKHDQFLAHYEEVLDFIKPWLL